MFERFTDRARRVAVLAQEEAAKLNHNYIGTEHILLGLIAEGEGVAAKVLADLGVDQGKVRERVVELIGRGDQLASGHIPFTPRAKHVMESSLREALQLGHNYIGTEHILLGLIREGEGIGAQVLTEFAMSLSNVRTAIIKTLQGYQAQEHPEPAPESFSEADESEGDALLPMVQCVALLEDMEPRRRRAALAYLNAWYAS